MCELYGLTDERKVELLLDMLSSSQQIGWWESYDDVLPPGYEVFVGLEADAQVKRAWEPLLVHGLLQTADYARAVLLGWASHRPGDIEALVEVRGSDRRPVRESSRSNLCQSWTKGFIRRRIGDQQVMKDQLNHLIALSELPRSRGPAEAGVGALSEGSTRMFDWAAPRARSGG